MKAATERKIEIWSVGILATALGFATGYWYAASVAAEMVKQHLAK